MNKFLLLPFIILFYGEIYSQGRKEKEEKPPVRSNKRELAIFVTPTNSDLLNSSRRHDKYANTQGGLSYNFGFNFCRAIASKFAISYGVEFSRYQNVTLYKAVSRSEKTVVDKDGYLYYPQNEANYTEKRTILAVEIPILFRFRTKTITGVNWFFEAGVKTHLVANSNLTKEGTYEKKGVYPLKGSNVFSLIDENDPGYGFTKTTYKVDKSVETVKAGFSVMINAGVMAKLTEFSYLLVSPSYIYSLTDYSSKDKEDYKNIMEETSAYTKLTLSQMGLRIGIVLKL